MEELALAMASLELLDKLIPIIDRNVRAGDVTAEEQQALKDKADKLRAGLDTAFDAPHWKID